LTDVFDCTGVIPGLGMLNLRDDNALPLILPLSSLILWCLAVAFFGVFLAVPLRKQVLLKENLVFPSGTATAQVISVLHNVPPPDDDGTRKRRKGVEREDVRYGAVAEDVEEVTKVDRSSWTALTYSFLLSSAVSMISLLFPVLSAIPIFDMFGGHLAANWLWFVTPSFSYVGQGIIMGFPTTASMSLGMMLGWAVMTPLADAEGWTTGDIRSDTGGRAWILWPALAIMTVEALLSIATMAYSIIPESPTERRMDVVDSEAAAEISRERSSDRSRHAEWKRHFDVPSSKIVWGGIALSIVGCVVIVSYIFGEEGIKAYATLIALVLASLFAVLG
jgi:OPT family oligopeptide transporter